MNEDSVIVILQEAVRSAILEAATTEINKHKAQFEFEMQKVKREVVNKLTDSVQIAASRDLPSGEYVIQIRINGDRKP